jgi:hypothetical protein
VIKTHHLRTWDGFLQHLKSQRQKRKLLFRGQSDSRWPLETTLERRLRKPVSIEDYYRLAAVRVRPQLESLTGRRHDLPPLSELRALLKNYDEFSLSGLPDEVLSYLIHLRHHGFPSPLLDWTRSPFVAAYFAFAGDQPGVARRSIYAWAHAPFRATGTNKPELRQIGSFLRTHQRHALQQCDYSLRTVFDTEKGKWSFAPHEEGFLGTGLAAERLLKFNIPSTERLKVLKFLDSVNLNAYSLFGTEDSLMETLALRELECR